MPLTHPDNFTSFAPELEQLELFIPNHLDASADLDAPHRPVTNDGRPWYPYNTDHFMTELKLTPCARLLWKWILLKGPAGSCVEIDLCDFRAITAEHRRGKPYCMKQIRKAVGELEALELITIGSEKLKVKGRHPGKVTNLTNRPKPGNLTSNTGNLSSKPENLSSTPPPETPTTTAFQKPSDLTYFTDLSRTAGAALAAPTVLEQRKEVSATPPTQTAPLADENTSLVDATTNCSVSEVARVQSKPVASFSAIEIDARSVVAQYIIQGEYQRASTLAAMYRVDYWSVIDQLGLADEPGAQVMGRRRT